MAQIDPQYTEVIPKRTLYPVSQHISLQWSNWFLQSDNYMDIHKHNHIWTHICTCVNFPLSAINHKMWTLYSCSLCIYSWHTMKMQHPRKNEITLDAKSIISIHGALIFKAENNVYNICMRLRDPQYEFNTSLISLV